jgi:homoserine kinase type II
VAVFTKPSKVDLEAFVEGIGVGKVDAFQPVEQGSVNSNFSVTAGDRRFFLRIYEEQDARGAAAELAMLEGLAGRGVATPRAVGRGTLAGKPAALFPWVEGAMSCQRGVTEARARAVGTELARVHLAGADLEAAPDRFGPDALRARLQTIDPDAFPAARLRRSLDALAAARDDSIPRGLAHGDLFRDNVLWLSSGDRVAALLDFESASRGAFAYDLAVCVLSWCYGDAFDPALARALVAGYEATRPLEPAEKHAFYTEARLAAVRFTITRITDYAMKGAEQAGPRVMKDWRRFLARLDALEAMGAEGFAALVGAPVT